jgi:hypothetical protein
MLYKNRACCSQSSFVHYTKMKFISLLYLIAVAVSTAPITPPTQPSAAQALVPVAAKAPVALPNVVEQIGRPVSYDAQGNKISK